MNGPGMNGVPLSDAPGAAPAGWGGAQPHRANASHELPPGVTVLDTAGAGGKRDTREAARAGAVKGEQGDLKSSSGECSAESGAKKAPGASDSDDQAAPSALPAKRKAAKIKEAADRTESPREGAAASRKGKGDRPKLPRPDAALPCPRCGSADTKFCYYNNYNVKQPRYFCKSCQRYWTAGGTLRNVPVGAGRRKSKSAQREQDKAQAERQAALAASAANLNAFAGGAFGNMFRVDQQMSLAAAAFASKAGAGPAGSHPGLPIFPGVGLPGAGQGAGLVGGLSGDLAGSLRALGAAGTPSVQALLDGGAPGAQATALGAVTTVDGSGRGEGAGEDGSDCDGLRRVRAKTVPGGADIGASAGAGSGEAPPVLANTSSGEAEAQGSEAGGASLGGAGSLGGSGGAGGSAGASATTSSHTHSDVSAVWNNSALNPYGMLMNQGAIGALDGGRGAADFLNFAATGSNNPLSQQLALQAQAAQAQQFQAALTAQAQAYNSQGGNLGNWWPYTGNNGLNGLSNTNSADWAAVAARLGSNMWGNSSNPFQYNTNGSPSGGLSSSGCPTNSVAGSCGTHADTSNGGSSAGTRGGSSLSAPAGLGAGLGASGASTPKMDGTNGLSRLGPNTLAASDLPPLDVPSVSAEPPFPQL